MRVAEVNKSVSETSRDRQDFVLCAVIGKLDRLLLLHRSGALGDGSEACILAAANGQLPVIKYFLSAGCAIANIASRALLAAAANGRLDVVKYLREQDCTAHIVNNAALKAAASKGHIEVVKYLHELGADLHACETIARELPLLPTHRTTTEYLAANGIFPEGPKVADLIRAIRSRDLPVIKRNSWGIEFAWYSDILIQAASETEEIELIQVLYERGLDVHAEKDLLLKVASERDNFALLKYLHQIGTNLDVAGRESLKSAAVAGHLAIVTYLVTNGADVSCIDSETLSLVRLNGHFSVFNYLTDCGVDAIAESQATITAMREELYNAPAIYRPSKLWEFFNDVNMTQLARDGIANFKRSINQNYFNFVPQSLADPQLLRLFRSWCLRPTISPFKVKLVDPDLMPTGRALVRNDRRIFKFDNRLRYLPRALQDLQAQIGRSVQLTYYRGLIAMLWDFALVNDKLGLASRLAEPRAGAPIETYFEGRVISQDLAHSIVETNSILNDTWNLLDGSRPHIVEVGAGYGRLGYVLLNALECQYVVFDIPPSLYVSQWYLSELFPNKRIFRFRHFDLFEEIAEELAQSDIAFFSANQIELIPEGYFDIGVNISSLHELKPDQIDNMLHQIFRVTRSFVYLKQYKEYVNPHDGLLIRENAYHVPSGWRHKYYRDDPVDMRFFETLIENVSHRSRVPAANISLHAQSVNASSERSEPTVSILLANYNHAQYLPTALAGICGQTRPASEIIVIDDGSTDDSVAIIEEFATRFPTIRLLKNGKNRGQHYSIQRALIAARGDYVVWASADDLLLPKFLECSLDALHKHPEAGLCFSQLGVFVDGTSERRDFTGENQGVAFEYRRFGGYLSQKQLAATLRKHYVWISGNTVVARRTALLEIGGFEKSLRWHADWFGFYAVALRYGVCVIPETLALMRERRETYSAQGIADQVEQARVLTAILDTIKSPKYFDLAPFFRACPSLLSPFGKKTLFVAIRNPRHWGFVWPLARWYAKRAWLHIAARRFNGVLVIPTHNACSGFYAYCRRSVVRGIELTVGPRISGNLRAKLSARRTALRGKK